MSTTHPAPVVSPAFWKAYWITVRPYLLFVSLSAGGVGLALATGLSDVQALVASVAFFGTYGLGQALTDTTQTDTDALSAPYRPLVRGEVTPRSVAAVSVVGLVACAAVFAAFNPWTLVVSALAVIGLATYTPMKRRWWAGPVWNSWIVALLPLIGWLCGGGSPFELDPSVGLAMGSVFATYATFVLLGYLKDVEADRATGYDTFPVHFGRRQATVLSGVFLALGVSCSVGLVASTTAAWSAGLVLWALGVFALVSAHITIFGVREDSRAGLPIAIDVAGFVMLHLGEVALLRPEWTGIAVVVAVLAAAALTQRPMLEQV